MYTFPFVPFRYSKALSIGVIIIVLCLLPSSEFSKIDMPVTFADSIVHFIMFFAFSGALFLDITKKRSGYKFLVVASIAILLSLVLGSLTELLQYVITPIHRTGSLVDLSFDFFGSAAGSVVGFLIRRKSSAVP